MSPSLILLGKLAASTPDVLGGCVLCGPDGCIVGPHEDRNRATVVSAPTHDRFNILDFSISTTAPPAISFLC